MDTIGDLIIPAPISQEVSGMESHDYYQLFNILKKSMTVRELYQQSQRER